MTASSAPRDRWLRLARAAWIAIVGLLVGLYVFSIPLQFAHAQILCRGESCPYDQLSPEDVPQFQLAGLSLSSYAVANVAIGAVFVLVFVIVAALIFWRRSDEPIGLLTSFALVAFGLAFNSPLAALGLLYPGLVLLSQLLDVCSTTALFVFALVFPNGRFVPGWTRWLVPIMALREAVRVFLPGALSSAWSIPLPIFFMLGAQAYRYLSVSNTIERQQTKWVMAGMLAGFGGFVGLLLWAVITSAGRPVGTASIIVTAFLRLCLVLVPLSIGTAILRSRLWDIDLLIRRTLIYGVLTGLLALVYLGAVLGLQALFTAFTGQQRSELVTVLSTLAIAALFVPVRNRVQAVIDRRFYRRKYDAARTLAEFGATLRDDVNLDDLTAHLLTTVDETMQPESVALWLVKRSFEGRGVPSLAPGEWMQVDQSRTPTVRPQPSSELVS